MTPIGRGQRELIIGDRKTGKTAIAIDAILNQKGTGVICVYVAIAQKESTTAGLVDILRRHGAMDYTIVVAAGASDPAPMQYIAPYAGCAMAEYFMYEQGKPTLVIYDDLSKQAVAYREVSLLLRRPPGREAFPGDIFYAHSRLLERSAKLANHYVILPEDTPTDNVTDEMGVDGKAYIGVPGLEEANHALKEHYPQGHKVVEDHQVGRIADGAADHRDPRGRGVGLYPHQRDLDHGRADLPGPDLFFAGVRPAIDVGISVSRVGGKAQISAMKKVAGGLRLDLAAFRELEAFAQLGTELDKATQRQLDRGYRMVELLKQPQYQPLSVIDQVMSLFSGIEGYLDDVDRRAVQKWEADFLRFMRERKSAVRDALDREKKLTPQIEADLPRPSRNSRRSGRDSLSPSVTSCSERPRRGCDTAPTDWHLIVGWGRLGKRARAHAIHDMNRLRINNHLLDQGTDDPTARRHVAGIQTRTDLLAELLDPAQRQPQLLALLILLMQRPTLRFQFRHPIPRNIHISLEFIVLNVSVGVHLHQPRHPSSDLADQLLQAPTRPPRPLLAALPAQSPLELPGQPRRVQQQSPHIGPHRLVQAFHSDRRIVADPHATGEPLRFRPIAPVITPASPLRLRRGPTAVSVTTPLAHHQARQQIARPLGRLAGVLAVLRQAFLHGGERRRLHDRRDRDRDLILGGRRCFAGGMSRERGDTTARAQPRTGWHAMDLVPVRSPM